MIKKLWFLLTEGQKKKAILLSFLMLLGAFVEMIGVGIIFPVFSILLNPTPTHKYYDYLPSFMIEKGEVYLVIYTLTFFLIIYIFKTIYLVFLTWKQSTFANKFYEYISGRLFEIYIGQKYKFHLLKNSSELLRNVVGESGACAEILKAILAIITEATVIIGICLLLVTINPLNAIFVFVFFSVLIYLFNLSTKKNLKLWGIEKQKISGLINKYTLETFGGIKEVKFYGRENYFLNKLFNLNDRNTFYQSRINFFQQLPRIYLELLTILCLIGLLLLEVFQGNSLLNLIPQLTVFLAASFRVIPSANKILSHTQVIKVCNASIELIYNDFLNLDCPVMKTEPFLSYKEVDEFRSLEMKNIFFRYDLNQEDSLKNLNFEIKKGESIGIKGESGAGKSTLIDIILGLLDPSEGSIFINGIVKNDSNINWGENVGYVPQNVFLLDDTIEKNIALGIPNNKIDKNKILSSIKSAQLDNYINSLPLGVKSVVGERGVRLSGGQRQRIGIARALYNDPDIIILDEATSALDSETEASFMEVIYALKGEKTILIVAHRLSTLSNCDRIIAIKDGEIIK
jgi:ABC-type multidrug transport system fused ATPase/permease subunit